jgi:simple sugar transport system ATP-binding protein
MVGTEDDALVSGIVDGRPAAASSAPAGPVLARVDGVALRRADGSVAVSGVSFDLHAGDILAVAGVDGNGQGELVRCLAGMARPDAGVVDVLGVRSDGRWTPGRVRAAGVAHVPEDRRRSGIVAGMTLARNHLLGHVDRPAFVRHGLIREQDLETAVAAGLSAYQVRSQGPRDLIERLSGGNQQKVVLARELSGSPKILLAAHPSRGLDIRTIRFVHERIEAARAAGLAVLLLSADLDEILRLADRVLVFAAGRTFGPTARAEVDRQRLGAWIAGHAEDAA